jgi:hypothetical protein
VIDQPAAVKFLKFHADFSFGPFTCRSCFSREMGQAHDTGLQQA